MQCFFKSAYKFVGSINDFSFWDFIQRAHNETYPLTQFISLTRSIFDSLQIPTSAPASKNSGVIIDTISNLGSAKLLLY